MKKIKPILVFLFVLLGVLQGKSQMDTKAAVPYLTKASFTLNYNQSYTLKMKNVTGKVIWSSTKTSVAKVDSNGTVKAMKKNGTATIKATVGGVTYRCKVYVYGTKISLTKVSMGIGENNSVKLRTSVKYKVKWKSSNKKIAKVTSTGTVIGVKKGTCTITAKIKGKNYKCKVTVLAKKATIKITPETIPYNGKYTIDTINNNYYYNDKTRNTYTLRSYMSKFEKEGGGTIILQKGTYIFSRCVYVPSNVTIILENDVVLKKSWATGSSNLQYQNTFFAVISPSIVNKVAQEQAAALAKGEEYFEQAQKVYQYPSAVKKYNGSKNVTFMGRKNGNATIDHNKLYYTFGISAGHAYKLTIQDIIFKNMDGNHFIELNSSKKVLIQRCVFKDDATTTKYNKGNAANEWKHSVKIKECINIDACDPNYAGYNNSWAYHDYTPCDGVEVRNCKFQNVIRALGSHKYTAKKGNGKWNTQVYNKNISVHDNTFEKISANAVEACNWANSKIYNNKFKNCFNKNADNPGHKSEVNPGKKSLNIKKNNSLKLRSMITIFGGKNINIYKNTFKDATIAISAFNLKNTGGGTMYEVSYYHLTEQNINNIKKNNTYEGMTSGCNWFFGNDIKKLNYPGKVTTIVSGTKTYLDGEANIDWDVVLKLYKKKYFAKVKAASDAEAEELNEASETTTEVTTESKVTKVTEATTKAKVTEATEATTKAKVTEATEATTNTEEEIEETGSVLE